MFQQCRHIQTNGFRCRQVALNARSFCYYHQNRQPRRRRSIIRTSHHTETYDYGAIPVADRAAAPQIQPPVELLFPEDTAAIQINLYRIAVAQAENRIDTRTANSMTWNQQVCLINLVRKPLLESAPAPQARIRSHCNSEDDDSGAGNSVSQGPVSRAVSRVILTPDGDEIAPPVEILEDNEAEPIHHKGCPCLLCAEKYRNQPPEEHHTDCQCGLCEDQESTDEGIPLADLTSEGPDQLSAITNNDVILSEARPGCAVEGSAVPRSATTPGVPGPDSGTWDSSLAQQGQVEEQGFSPALEAGPKDRTALPQAGAEPTGAATEVLHPTPYPLPPRPRIARASALLSGSANRDPLNRPWSVAEYTFGDAVRRHEAQYAARAAAALAVGIEPPPYEPFITGHLHPGTPEWEEEQQMQQHSSEYWAEHFRKQIAERPDIQQYLDEEAND